MADDHRAAQRRHEGFGPDDPESGRARGEPAPRMSRAEMRRRDRESSRPTREAYQQGRRDARRRPSAGEQVRSRARSEVQAPIRTSVRSSSPQRAVVGTMTFATVFALLSEELGVAQGTPAPGQAVKIMLGGGVATILLLVISHAGDGGAELAEGIALVSMVTVVLVKGGKLWQWANGTFGSKPTLPTGTTATSPSTLSTGPGGTPAPNVQPSPAGVLSPANPYLTRAAGH